MTFDYYERRETLLRNEFEQATNPERMQELIDNAILEGKTGFSIELDRSPVDGSSRSDKLFWLLSKNLRNQHEEIRGVQLSGTTLSFKFKGCG